LAHLKQIQRLNSDNLELDAVLILFLTCGFVFQIAEGHRLRLSSLEYYICQSTYGGVLVERTDCAGDFYFLKYFIGKGIGRLLVVTFLGN
jgi:hypothetical protein